MQDFPLEKLKHRFFTAIHPVEKPPVESSIKTPVVACSACLYGEPVRYDGTDKKTNNILILNELGIILKPLCPEVFADMGIPRPPIQRVQLSSKASEIISVREVHNPERDHTIQLKNASDALYSEYSYADAWILKARSPSCGLGSSPLFNQEKKQIDLGDGVFAHKIKDSHAGLHIDEEALTSPLHSAAFAAALHLTIRLRANPDYQPRHALMQTLLPILKSPRKAEAFFDWLQQIDATNLEKLLLAD